MVARVCGNANEGVALQFATVARTWRAVLRIATAGRRPGKQQSAILRGITHPVSVHRSKYPTDPALKARRLEWPTPEKPSSRGIFRRLGAFTSSSPSLFALLFVSRPFFIFYFLYFFLLLLCTVSRQFNGNTRGYQTSLYRFFFFFNFFSSSLLSRRWICRNRETAREREWLETELVGLNSRNKSEYPGAEEPDRCRHCG